MKSVQRRLILIILLAIAVRVAAAVVIGDTNVAWNYEYEDIARNLVERGTYAYSFYDLTDPRPTSFLPPLYPLLLAAADSLSPARDFVVRIVQILASGGIVVGTYALARELGGSQRQGLLAALGVALYPPAVAYAVDVTTVTFEMLFVVLGAWLVLRAANHPAARSAAGAGAVLGLAALTRSPWLATIFLALLWLAWYGFRRGVAISVRLHLMGALLVGAVVLLAPWAAYNYTTHGAVRLTSTNGGLNFWIGNNSQATGEYVFPRRIDEDLVLQVADWPEVERDRFFYRRGLAFVRESPRHFLELAGRKFAYHVFFRPNIGSNYQSASVPLELARRAFIFSWLVLLPFALYGVLHDRGRWSLHAWPAAIFLSQAALAALYFAGTRFRTPTDPFVIVWAAMGLTALLDTRLARKTHATLR